MYNEILRASQKFTEEHHYAPTRLLMNPTIYYKLCKEVYGNCEYILIVHRKFLGMFVIISESTNRFEFE